MYKNTASQKWVVFAFDRTDNTPKTGDADQITANLRIDGGEANAVDDTNPTELEDGYYIFDLTQAETNGDNIVICPASSTEDIQVIGVPGAVWTRSTGAHLTAIPWNNSWDSEVQSEAEDAIKVYGLDHLIHTAAAEDEVADNSVIARLAAHSGDWSDYNDETDSLEALRDRGDAEWITAVGFSTHAAADIWSVEIRALTDKSGFALSAAGNTAVIDEFKTQAAVDPTGFKVNVMEVNGTAQTANDNGADINAILEDTGTTLDTLIKDIPTVAEFEARTLVAADYVVVGDTIAGVTAVGTCTTNMDMRGTDNAALAATALSNATWTDAKAGYLTGAVATAVALTTVDTVVDAIKVVTDALTAAGATKLATSAGTMVTGTVSHDNTAATTTVFYCDDITEATADHYNGRIVIFTSGALQYQATDITDYELSAGEGKFTVTALTEAPADNVTFIIV